MGFRIDSAYGSLQTNWCKLFRKYIYKNLILISLKVTGKALSWHLNSKFSKVEHAKMEHNKSSHMEAFSFDKLYVYNNTFEWFKLNDILPIAFLAGWVGSI